MRAAARATPTASGTLLKVIAPTRSTPARFSVSSWTAVVVLGVVGGDGPVEGIGVAPRPDDADDEDLGTSSS